MKILIVSDAWAPQVNGVVRTLVALRRELDKTGHRTIMITPDLFRTLPCPFYPEIRLAMGAGRRIGALIADAEPDAIHIVTEGPLGLAARRWCLRHGRPFTTAYHTRFPEYLAARMVAPRRLVYAALRRFHAPSQGVMVAAESVRPGDLSPGVSEYPRSLNEAHLSPPHDRTGRKEVTLPSGLGRNSRGFWAISSARGMCRARRKAGRGR